MADEFEYDVAFSFTAQDEALATQLNDLVADRLKTFIYSERQKELASTDGQTTFSEVYGKKARVVVTGRDVARNSSSAFADSLPQAYDRPEALLQC